MSKPDATNLPADRGENRGQPPNVVLITLDAFNYDLFVENIDSLPNLKRLTAESVSFENAFSIGPSTFFAFPGIIGSVYPYSLGIGIDPNVKSIDEALKEQGYRTAQINECNALITPFFGYGRQTDYQKHFLNLSHADVDRKLVGTFLRAGGERQAKKALRWSYLLKRVYRRVDQTWVGALGRHGSHIARFVRLYLMTNTESFRERHKLYSEFRGEVLDFIGRQFESPQFLFIHSIVNHLPYFPPDEGSTFTAREIDYLNYRGLSGFVSRGVCERLKSLYIESMRRTDHLIGDILDALTQANTLDSTLLVLTADHGEEFMEEGYFGHVDESSSDRLLHVPLMFRWPNQLKPATVSAPVSTVDILPTVCELVGSPIPETSRGISLATAIEATGEAPSEVQPLWDRPIFSEAWATDGLLDRKAGHGSHKKIFTVRKGSHKLRVIQRGSRRNAVREQPHLVNWTTNETMDPVANPAITDDLRRALQAHLDSEAAFAKAVHTSAERRRIRKAMTRLRPQD
jgi:arylsulfatase A-like enzyme